MSRTLRSALPVLAVAFVAYAAYGVLGSDAMRWSTFREYVFSSAILEGLRLTVLLAVGAQALSIVVGVLVAMLRESSSRVLAALSMAYVAVLRAVPLLVQILLWYNLALFFPTIGISVPFTDIGFSVSTNAVIGPTTACLIALSLAESAYMAEIIRGGIAAVPAGQLEGARSLGMTRSQAYRRIILPQAARIMVPPTGNQFIGLLKATSLVAVVGAGDLLTKAQYIYADNYQILPLLIVATFWYLVLTIVATAAQFVIEKRLAHEPLLPPRRSRGVAKRTRPPEPVLRADWTGEPQ